MSDMPKIGCVNHDCEQCSQLEKAARQALEAAEGLAREAGEAGNSYLVAGLVKLIVPLRRALQERGSVEQPAQQEPVAWGLFAKVEDGDFVLQHPVRFTENDAKADRSMYERSTVIEIRPLYTRPPAREPLTHDELAKVLGFGEHTTASTRSTLTNIARAIEAAHGIKGDA